MDQYLFFQMHKQLIIRPVALSQGWNTGMHMKVLQSFDVKKYSKRNAEDMKHRKIKSADHF